MAIGHLRVTCHGRRKGHTMAGGLAYRCGENLRCSRTGRRHKGRRRAKSVLKWGIAKARETPLARSLTALATGIEAREKRRDAHIARDVQFALPWKLNSDDQIALTRQFAELVARRYMTIGAWAVHAAQPGEDGDARNVHAHFMVATRRLDEDGILDEKITELDPGPRGRAEITELRRLWQGCANAMLERRGSAERVNMERRPDRDPQPTLGQKCTGRERRARRKRGHLTAGQSAAELVADGGAVTRQGRNLGSHGSRKRQRRRERLRHLRDNQPPALGPPEPELAQVRIGPPPTLETHPQLHDFGTLVDESEALEIAQNDHEIAAPVRVAPVALGGAIRTPGRPVVHEFGDIIDAVDDAEAMQLARAEPQAKRFGPLPEFAPIPSFAPLPTLATHPQLHDFGTLVDESEAVEIAQNDHGIAAPARVAPVALGGAIRTPGRPVVHEFGDIIDAVDDAEAMQLARAELQAKRFGPLPEFTPIPSFAPLLALAPMPEFAPLPELGPLPTVSVGRPNRAREVHAVIHEFGEFVDDAEAIELARRYLVVATRAEETHAEKTPTAPAAVASAGINPSADRDVLRTVARGLRLTVLSAAVRAWRRVRNAITADGIRAAGEQIARRQGRGPTFEGLRDATRVTIVMHLRAWTLAAWRGPDMRARATASPLRAWRAWWDREQGEQLPVLHDRAWMAEAGLTAPEPVLAQTERAAKPAPTLELVTEPKPSPAPEPGRTVVSESAPTPQHEPTPEPARTASPEPTPTPEPVPPAQPEAPDEEPDPLTKAIASITWQRLRGTGRSGRTREERQAWIRVQLEKQKGTGLRTAHALDIAAETAARTIDGWQGEHFGRDAAGGPLPPPSPYDREFTEEFESMGGTLEWVGWIAQTAIDNRVPRLVSEVKRLVARAEGIEFAPTRITAPTPGPAVQRRDGPDRGPNTR